MHAMGAHGCFLLVRRRPGLRQDGACWTPAGTMPLMQNDAPWTPLEPSADCGRGPRARHADGEGPNRAGQLPADAEQPAGRMQPEELARSADGAGRGADRRGAGRAAVRRAGPCGQRRAHRALHAQLPARHRRVRAGRGAAGRADAARAADCRRAAAEHRALVPLRRHLVGRGLPGGTAGARRRQGRAAGGPAAAQQRRAGAALGAPAVRAGRSSTSRLARAPRRRPQADPGARAWSGWRRRGAAARDGASACARSSGCRPRRLQANHPPRDSAGRSDPARA
jgi:hypothetical protein